MLGIRKIKTQALLILSLRAMIQNQFWLQEHSEILISSLDSSNHYLTLLTFLTHNFYLLYGGEKVFLFFIKRSELQGNFSRKPLT